MTSKAAPNSNTACAPAKVVAQEQNRAQNAQDQQNAVTATKAEELCTTRPARKAAGGNCGDANSLRREIYKVDPVYYRKRVAGDFVAEWVRRHDQARRQASAALSPAPKMQERNDDEVKESTSSQKSRTLRGRRRMDQAAGGPSRCSG